MKYNLGLLVLVIYVHVITAFGSSEDRFIKKYAMMKIYESCFGPDVVRQIRHEMKAACAKCASYEAPPTTPAPQPTTVEAQPADSPTGNSGFPNNNAPLDIEKLHQAIMAYRPSGGLPFFYPGYQQIPFSPYGGFPVVGQQFYPGSHRMSRDMDVRAQIEAITSRMSGKVKNVTCVMQELGYLDDNLEPNFGKISERIGNLPVDDELKRDMQDGVSFCKQFSQCVPEVNKDKSPLSRELIRPMFFFKCYKHKKLEACIMKDVREKYAGVSDDFENGDVELRRTGRQGKAEKIDDKEKEIDDLASSMYDFLYASDSGFDIDGIL
ncbi:uncharacterized protein LOC143194162 isoform X2 [Rhynchophorus ferrugineus]|uniref:uncharacterized protein LOC143194162 isoform X2 n=1 Tax=Rhynchophorus ferrugineus TaxID=354439 RepID=UPI003FCD6E9B